MKNNNDKLAIIGLLIAVIAIVVSLTTPEIREILGIEKETKKDSLVQDSNLDSSIVQIPEPPVEETPIEPNYPNTGNDDDDKILPKKELEKPAQYTSFVIDDNKKGIPDVEIYCPNCIIKKVKTDAEGGFKLESYFDENAAFWQSELTISKNNKSITETIDWREKSPKLINL